MIREPAKYEEWLTTIANTRLIYNTMEELENMMDNHSLHSNGIKRCFGTPQKLRSAFRDLKVEASLMTDDVVSLDRLLQRYKKAWIFFRSNLARRSVPIAVVLKLLAFYYPPYRSEGLSKKDIAIFEQVVDQNINMPFLILMLMGAIPGYDSKKGDVVNMPHQYEAVLELLEKFTEKSILLFKTLPVIIRARDEEQKTRLMLLFHVARILDTYEVYAEQKNLYDAASDAKSNRIDLDIDGFWNECDGRMERTNFWQIESLDDKGMYYITQWCKDSSNKLTGIRYALLLAELTDGNIAAYILHPEAIKHRMEGQAYSDADNVWYKFNMPASDTPDMLPLARLMASTIWPLNINLTRVTDESILETYDRWLNKSCKIIKPFASLEYRFYPNLYAVTVKALYIPTDIEGEYFKVPRESFEGFDRIQLGDNVGTLFMNGETYLAFDEFSIYVNTNENELQKYEIQRVSIID